jgi:hypothetical protein
MRIVPDKYFQKLGCMSISNVDALSISVKINIEIESDVIMVAGFFQLLPVKEPPRIIGSSVKTHGAKTVRIPAMKDTNKYSIARLID